MTGWKVRKSMYAQKNKSEPLWRVIKQSDECKDEMIREFVGKHLCKTCHGQQQYNFFGSHCQYFTYISCGYNESSCCDALQYEWVCTAQVPDFIGSYFLLIN